jgi:serine/threonine protein kinase/tetratricopeptide (TPR) repeat protein
LPEKIAYQGAGSSDTPVVNAFKQRVEEVFADAIEITAPAARAFYLRRACGADKVLSDAVERLLNAHERAGEFLQSPPSVETSEFGWPDCALPTSEKAGDLIGRYRLVEQIGEGGFGVVWLAEQLEPVHRQVALKVIKAGMDTRQVIARFEAERQALALMDHPNIARVFDGGATEAGRPYFVMELVPGLPITSYCEKNRLSVRARLELFISVCQAIQHSHQKGIIHRDLKPSNILVTEQNSKPVLKIIDFGVAKAIQGRLTDKTLVTDFRQFLGTPCYMSPEQASLGNLDIDTRSDIYSLGVLLCELLTGYCPFEACQLRAAGLDEMRRIIREQDPPKPSTRLRRLNPVELAAVAQQRLAVPAKLIALLQGDLDWIVMKCLEKDRAQRYVTVRELALDVEHHLNHEPIRAAAPTTLYRTQKFIRRHKTSLALASWLALLLVAGLVMSTWQAIRATRAERRAITGASKIRQIDQFLQEMLQSVGPSVARGRSTELLREILDHTAQRLDQALENQPEVEADLRSILGGVYLEMGEYTNAAAMHEKAVVLRRKLHGGEHPEVASSLASLAQVFMAQGLLPKAEAIQHEALALRRKLLPPVHPDVAQSLSDLGHILKNELKLSEAESLQRDALAMRRTLLGSNNLSLANSLSRLALTLQAQGKHAESESHVREALSIHQRTGAWDHPNVGNLLDALGLALSGQGKLAEAERAYREGLNLRTRLLRNDHPDLVYSFTHLGWSLWRQDKLPEAEDMFDRAFQVALLSGCHGPAGVRRDLAYALRIQAKFEQVKEVLRRGAECATPVQMNDYAWFLATCEDPSARDPNAAINYAEQAVAATQRKDANYLDTLAAAYAGAYRFDQARAAQREALTLLSNPGARKDFADRLKLYEEDLPYHERGPVAERARRLLLLGRFAEAEGPARECLADRQRDLVDDWRLSNAQSMLGGSLLGQGKYSDAEPFLVSGCNGLWEGQDKIPRNAKPRLAEALQRVVQLYEETNRSEQARPWKQRLADFSKK